MLGWTHSGFNCHRGNYLAADDSEARQRVARYLLHPPLSLERMTYDDETGEVTYRSDRQQRLERFAPLDFLARVASHIPDKGSQLVRYYGAYSNKSRGMQKKAEQLEQPPYEPVEPQAPLSTRRNWARLLAAVWGADPLECPRCRGPMKIVGAITDPVVVRKILLHLGLWDVPPRGPPRHVWRDPEPPNDGHLPVPDPAHASQTPEQPGSQDDSQACEHPVSHEEAPDPWLDVWPDKDPDWAD
jgi:hypothetical protein